MDAVSTALSYLSLTASRCLKLFYTCEKSIPLKPPGNSDMHH